ncbi:MAG: peptide maturation system acyl carrier-related protein [Clostridiales bacterium]
MEKLGVKKGYSIEEIKEKLENIMEDRFEINIDKLKVDYFKENLLGSYFRFKARDLVYILIDVEEVFKISIEKEEIINGNFKSLESISKLINRISFL